MVSGQQQANATAGLDGLPLDRLQPATPGMPEPASAAHARQLTFIVQCFALALGSASLMVLTGWLAGVPWLCRLGTANAMAPNTSLAFLLAAGSLWLATTRGSAPRRSAGGLALAVAVLLLGAATGMQYVSGVDLHIDQLLAVDVMGQVATAAPGRMAPVTTILMVNLGLALLALHLDGRRSALALQPLAAGQFLVALMASYSYTEAGESMQSVALFHGVALHTAASFMAASLALVCASPGRGVASIFLGPGVGGTVARRLLPWAVLLPPGLAWLLVEAQDAGYLSVELGVPMLVAQTISVFTVLLILTARAMERADQRRLAAEDESRRSEVRYRSLFEGVPIGLLRSAPNGRIYEANPAAVRLLEFPTLDALLGTRVETLYLDPADIQRLGRLVRTSDAVRGFQCRLRRADGGSIMARLNIDTVRDAAGRVRHFESSIEDVTDLWESQCELKELNDTLELRITERNRELEAVNREMETFAYSVSHDLRAPLRAIDGFSQVLLADHAHQLDEAGKDSLHRVRGASRRMAQLINGMLQLSRVTRGEMEVGVVDLSALAAEVVAGLRHAAPERPVEVSIAPGVAAMGDERLLRTLLENLLSNAFKFTSHTPMARIEFAATGCGDQVECHVRDNGAGFDPQYADRLFGAFQRLHSTTEFPGNGIGLATVKRIINRLGGRVWAEGAVGQGACFHFSLPLPTGVPPRNGVAA